MTRKVSYVFQEDGVHAIEDGKVVASAADLEELEEKLASEVEDVVTEDDKIRTATHIVTPNGLKGKLMGKPYESVWGTEVTVRFENGHIAHLQVTADDEFVTERSEAVDELEAIRETLAEPVLGDKLSLESRQADLKDVISSLRQLGSTKLSDSILAELDELRAEAAYELSHVGEALDYLRNSEPYAPPVNAYDMQVVEQESMGGHTGSWLDEVAQDMIREAENTDFDKLLNEGPEVFVTGLDTAPLGDQGATRSIAASYIRTKTAAARPEIREKYEEMWLERVEACRRDELATRKTEMTKEAATQDPYSDAPDESLFM